LVYAVFLDILGTTRFFTSLPDNYDFEQENRPLISSYNLARKTFHQGISSATRIASGGLVFRASFSDCAYLIYEEPDSLLMAIHVAMTIFNGSVPVRGGVGKGNFGLDHTIHIADSTSSSTEASFYGSSIVRAHQAERCGLKGFRVFVHSSAAQPLMDTHKGLKVFPVRDWTGYEEGGHPPHKGSTVIEIEGECPSEIKHELCYIGSDEVDIYFRGLDMIQRCFPPSYKDIIHYEHTKLALNRFQKLREQSIPAAAQGPLVTSRPVSRAVIRKNSEKNGPKRNI